jgi:hypothetical protein
LVSVGFVNAALALGCMTREWENVLLGYIVWADSLIIVVRSHASGSVEHPYDGGFVVYGVLGGAAVIFFLARVWEKPTMVVVAVQGAPNDRLFAVLTGHY